MFELWMFFKNRIKCFTPQFIFHCCLGQTTVWNGLALNEYPEEVETKVTEAILNNLTQWLQAIEIISLL